MRPPHDGQNHGPRRRAPQFYLDRDFFLGNHADIFAPGNSPPRLLPRRPAGERGVTHLLLHSSTMQNVMARRGTMETRLAELIAAHELVPVREAEPMNMENRPRKKVKKSAAPPRLRPVGVPAAPHAAVTVLYLILAFPTPSTFP